MAEKHIGEHQSAGVDERLARLAVLIFQLHQRIERRARRLLANALPQLLANQAQGNRQRKHLRNTLNREIHLALAQAIVFAIKQVEIYPELVGIHLR